MIDRPVHSVNLGQGQGVPPDPELPSIAGLDLEVSAANVVRWGGDRNRYVSSLAAVSTTDPGQFRQIAAVAAWRAGVIGMRAAALRALDGLLAAQPRTLGAVLGLPAEQVPAFALGQTNDRFAWPTWRTDYSFLIARVGGFVGLGGPWQSPPHSVSAVGPGRWLAEADGSTWNVDVDIFGHAITAADPAQAHEPYTGNSTATLRTRATSYLLDVVHEPPS